MPCKEEEDKVNVSKLNKVNFISASVRGEGLVKARGEMLKQVQHDATQKKRLKDAKPKANSRGLLSPWKQKRRRNGV